MRFVLCLVFCLAFAGCAANFVVLRDVPPNPSFVVIPANYYRNEVEFANEIESYLISSGVSVLSSPTVKEVEAKNEAEQAGLKSAEPVQAQATRAQVALTERYRAFEDTNADYIVFCYADKRQIKIVRKSSREVLGVFEIKPKSAEEYRTANPRKVVRSALKSLGFSVR